MAESIYEKRVVAFVDILGFRNMVNKADPDGANKIKYALERITEVRKRSEGVPGLNVSTFSDCAVISYPLNDRNSFFYTLIDLVHLQLDLVLYGVLIRGAVVIGDLYHDGDIVFGPAMNAAYTLESDVAVYPRIILTQETFKTGVEASVKGLAYGTEEDEKMLESLVRLDSDGLYYIDMLHQDQELDYPATDYYKWLSTIKDLIEDGLEGNKTNEKVMVKYRWLREYFNSVVTDDGAYFPVPEDLNREELKKFRGSYALLKIE